MTRRQILLSYLWPVMANGKVYWPAIMPRKLADIIDSWAANER